MVCSRWLLASAETVSGRLRRAGRPVVVQDTGFSSVLPVGEGILALQSIDDAAAAIDEVESDYSRHADAARAVAEDYFDSDKVLTRLLETVWATTAQPI